MKVVIDTNVMVSYILGSKHAPFKILELVLSGKITPVVSEELFEEVIEILKKNANTL